MANKTQKSKKSKIISRIIATLSALAAVGFGAKYLVNRLSSGGNSNDGPETVQRLSTAQDLSFDESTYTLSWSNVKNADGYKIDINGKVVESDTNKCHYVPNTQNTTFKVQATDSTNKYLHSDWSSEYTYTLTNSQVSVGSVTTFVNGMVHTLDVNNVVTVYPDDNILCVTAVFDNGRFYKIERTYPSEVTSLKDMMENADYGTSGTLHSFESKNYNSMDYYLRSDSYKGMLEQYRQQGYTFDVVTSQAYRVDDYRMGVDSTLKLTSGEDVKYVECSMTCLVEDSAEESYKYTRALVNLDNSKVRMTSCIELAGDFALFAESCDKENQKTNTTNTSKSFTYDAGISY